MSVPGVGSHSLLLTGLRPVTIGFFDDMYVPLAYLPQPSALYVNLPHVSRHTYSDG